MSGKDGEKQEWAWQLSQYLGVAHAQFGRGFLDKIANTYYDMEKNDKNGFYLSAVSHKQQLITLRGSTNDPFVNIFHAMAGNADAAQDFFKDKSHLDYFVNNRSIQHNWLTDHYLGSVAPHVADILNSYRDNVYSRLSTLGPKAGGGTGNVTDQISPFLDRNGKPLPGFENLPYGVDFNGNDLLRTLAEADHDRVAYQSVITGQMDAANHFLKAQIEYADKYHVTGIERQNAIGQAGQQYGRTMRELLGLNAQVQTGDAKNADDRANTILGFTTSIIGLAASKNPYTAPAWSLSSGFITKKLTSNELAQVQAAVSNLNHNNEFAARLTMINEMQNDGGFSGSQADARTWGSDLKPADRFYDQNTGHLLDPDHMNAAQRKNYVNWLADSGTHAVRVGMEPIDEGFTTGYGDTDTYTGPS